MAGARRSARGPRGGGESPADRALRALRAPRALGPASKRALRRRSAHSAPKTACNHLNQGKVLKMLAAMEPTPESTNRDTVEDFLTTGRTGRRNAMADILGEHASTGSGDLSERMEGLSTDQMAAGPSTSGGSGAGQPGQPIEGATTSEAGSAGSAPKEGGR